MSAEHLSEESEHCVDDSEYEYEPTEESMDVESAVSDNDGPETPGSEEEDDLAEDPAIPYLADKRLRPALLAALHAYCGVIDYEPYPFLYNDEKPVPEEAYAELGTVIFDWFHCPE